ncbi:MAG: hypothetical protein H8E21_14210 [Gammaproteobacteria bacterium]|nr:hypothetical protein [Gammaproteobacteria bacterium]MBL6998401.1 hypothetical protein [Gammaproteobacteria bacterium]
MKILFIISTPGGTSILLPLAAACRRKGVEWGAFFTNDGVRLLASDDVADALRCARKVVVCEHSWARFMAGESCPQTLGSQTQNSILVGEADHVISL